MEGYSSIVSFYINEVMECINQLKASHKKYYADELLFAYRGESKDYLSTSLQPSIFRTPSHIQKELHLFELLCDYNLVHKSATSIEKAIESQHYIAISRMLDISFSALSALYFACNSNKEDPGKLFVFGFPKHYSPHSNYVQNFYDKMLSGEDFSYSRNFKVFSHSYSNERIRAQKGGFIFFPGADFIPINECYFKTIPIEVKHKKHILEELRLIFEINIANIYPEKENIAQIIKENFEKNSFDSNASALTLRNEIDIYFERLNYELRLTKKDNNAINRFLRKEQNDLLSFVRYMYPSQKSTDRNDTLEKLEEDITNKFLTFRLMFEEVYG